MTRLILLLALASSCLSLAAAAAAAPHAAAQPPHERRRYPTLLQRDHRPPEPYPGFYGRVDKCLQKLTAKCGQEIFVSILGSGAHVSERCCLSLVAMGRRCHRTILKATLELPQFSKREQGKIMNRDANVWARCVLVSDGFRFGPNKSRLTPSPSPSPSYTV